ncbi:hypothetical protein C7S18_15995 [Ahniella affigens]|uniref:Uncharacterized protein n=2 Tax=Ahniella affigens TaxID=2021234 RepID=A0A2P1PUT4_9GAMM|nr:hypothetical protein C7S18_15995 [Ahniella affigens]
MLALIFSCASAKKHFPEFALWINRTQEMPESYVGKQDGHPCGEVAIIQTDRIPEYEPGARLQPEQVHEVDAEGEVLRTWVTPVDAEPLAIAGTRLYVRLHHDTYVIGLDRSIEVADLPQKRMESINPECAVPSTLNMGAYGVCHVFQDVVSGANRSLVYSMICS